MGYTVDLDTFRRSFSDSYSSDKSQSQKMKFRCSSSFQTVPIPSFMVK